MKTVMLSLSLTCLLIGAGSGQQMNSKPNSSRIRGVWKQVEATSANGETSKSTLPSLAIFTEGYYALLEVTGERPAPRRGQATDADKIKLFETLVANAGTYTFDGTTVTRHAQIAKSQFLIGSSVASQVTITGNRFVETLSEGPNKGRKFTYDRVE